MSGGFHTGVREWGAEAALDAAPDGFAAYGPEGGLVFLNAAGDRLWGRTRAEALGKTLRPGPQFISGHEGPESVFEATVCHVAGGGLHVWFRPAGARVDGGAELREEVRRRREAEEQLLHAQKMEAVGRLAGGVAHDFNNLLTGIGGNTELLRAAVAGDAVLVDYADTVLDGVTRAAALTGQLLALSRKQPPQPTTFHLNDAVRQISRMLRRIIGEDVALAQELDPDVKWIRADRFQIDQVVLNLAVNARDAMPHGGQLTIRTTNARVEAGAVDGMARGDYVLLSVADNGVGMSAATRERIFEPFFTTKPQGKGTGLGLSIVHSIVKENGGWVAVTSEPGCGARFDIYLPAAEAGTARSEAPAGRATAASGGRVLVVEDDATVRTFTARVLRKAGYTVAEARTAPEALATARAPGFDLLVSDVVLPGMDGPELARRMLAECPAMRVLFMSGYTEGNALEDLLERGVSLLWKPFTGSALLRRVEGALEEGRQ